MAKEEIKEPKAAPASKVDVAFKPSALHLSILLDDAIKARNAWRVEYSALTRGPIDEALKVELRKLWRRFMEIYR